MLWAGVDETKVETETYQSSVEVPSAAIRALRLVSAEASGDGCEGLHSHLTCTFKGGDSDTDLGGVKLHQRVCRCLCRFGVSAGMNCDDVCWHVQGISLSHLCAVVSETKLVSIQVLQGDGMAVLFKCGKMALISDNTHVQNLLQSRAERPSLTQNTA